jgi:hypothetical protein
LDDALWGWRRRDRPSAYPVEVYQAPDDTLAALCTGRLLCGQRREPFGVLSDLALPGGQIRDDAIRSLLGAVPDDATATVLCPRSDTSLREALASTGSRAAGTETAMLLPLSARAARLASGPPLAWYVAIESVVGV